jgi:hypothetical protein
MKTLLLVSMLSLTLPAGALADIIVFRESETARVTVAGRVVSFPIVTYIVHDTESDQYSALGLIRAGANKYYSVTNNTRHQVTRGIAGPGGNYMVFSKVADSNDDPSAIVSSYFAKGRETTLELGNGNTAQFPRSAKAVTRGVQSASGQIGIYESSSTLVFQFTETKTANTAGESMAAVIERLRQRFVAQGYVPAPE